MGAIGLGALLVLWAVLLGESQVAVGLRRALGSLLATPLSRLWMVLVVVLLFLALLAWSPVAARATPLGVALYALVLCGGALLVGRRSASPDRRSLTNT